MKITNVMAASLNGRIAAQAMESDEDRQKLGLSSPVDFQHLCEQIAHSDAIIVGASSIRASGRCIEQAGRGGKFPLWVILARQELPSHLPFWRQTHIPRVIISPTSIVIPASSQVQHVTCTNANPAPFVQQWLAGRKMQQALLFGGGTVNKYFYEAGLVDELKLTISPLLIGGKSCPELIDPAMSQHVHFKLLSSHHSQSFVFLDYIVLKSI